MLQSYNLSVSIYLVDDHPCILQGLSEAIGRMPFYHVVGKSTSGPAALKQIALLEPEIVILDLDLPDMNGWQLIDESVIYPERFLLYSHFLDDERILRAQEIGVKAGLEKSRSLQDVFQCLEKLKRGENLFLSKTGFQNNNDKPLTGNPKNSFSELSLQEKKILQLVADGNNSQAIAESMFLSKRTVEWYRTRICRKMGVSGWGGLVHFAVLNRDKILIELQSA